MINFYTINLALREQLTNNSAFFSLLETKKIEISEFINVNHIRAPWCGVYRQGYTADPRTLQTPATWTIGPTLFVILQAKSIQSGEDCEKILENLLDKCLDAIFADKTLGGEIDIIKRFDVEYSYNREVESTMHYQQAILKLEVEKNV